MNRTRILWTPQAATDLEEIFEFIARDSPHYARHVVRGLVERVDALETFRRMGRVVPEIGLEEVRELIHDAYRIVYRLEEPSVARILTIFRASRQFPDLG